MIHEIALQSLMPVVWIVAFLWIVFFNRVDIASSNLLPTASTQPFTPSSKSLAIYASMQRQALWITTMKCSKQSSLNCCLPCHSALSISAMENQFVLQLWNYWSVGSALKWCSPILGGLGATKRTNIPLGYASQNHWTISCGTKSVRGQNREVESYHLI